MRLAARQTARGQKFQYPAMKAGTAEAVPAMPITRRRRNTRPGSLRDSIGLRGSARSCTARGVRSNAGNQPVADHQLLGGFGHVLLLHIGHPLGRLDADGFPHGVKNARLGDPTEIAPRGRRPKRGHVERHGFRQPVRRCHARGLAPMAVTALTVSAAQCANSAMRLSWSSSTRNAQRPDTSRGICAAQRAW